MGFFHREFGELVGRNPELFRNDKGVWFIGGNWRKNGYTIYANLPFDSVTYGAGFAD